MKTTSMLRTIIKEELKKLNEANRTQDDVISDVKECVTEIAKLQKQLEALHIEFDTFNVTNASDLISNLVDTIKSVAPYAAVMNKKTYITVSIRDKKDYFVTDVTPTKKNFVKFKAEVESKFGDTGVIKFKNSSYATEKSTGDDLIKSFEVWPLESYTQKNHGKIRWSDINKPSK